MRKEKLKHGAFWPARTLPFIALWTGSYIITWLATYLLIAPLNIYSYLPGIQGVTFIIFFTTLLPALIQTQIVERFMDQSMRRWMLYTGIGAIASSYIVERIMTASRGSDDVLLVLGLMLPTTLIQAIWLHRRVHTAWLWVLASAVGSLLFALPIRNTTSGPSFLLVVAGLLYGLIQGSIMRHLLMRPKDTEKAKIDFAAEPQADNAGRLERLSTSEHLRVIAPWAIADEQAQQHETR